MAKNALSPAQYALRNQQNAPGIKKTPGAMINKG